MHDDVFYAQADAASPAVALRPAQALYKHTEEVRYFYVLLFALIAGGAIKLPPGDEPLVAAPTGGLPQ